MWALFKSLSAFQYTNNKNPYCYKFFQQVNFKKHEKIEFPKF